MRALSVGIVRASYDSRNNALAIRRGVRTACSAGRVVAQAPVAIHRRRGPPRGLEVLRGARDEAAARLIQRVEPLEVQGAAGPARDLRWKTPASRMSHKSDSELKNRGLSRALAVRARLLKRCDGTAWLLSSNRGQLTR